jgi:alpha-tubulin suppressor-like RCC1 family protein
MKLSRPATLVIPAIFVSLFALVSAAPASAQTPYPTAWRWGTDGGPKPNRSTSDVPVKVTIPDPGASVVQVSTSQSDEYFLMSDGTVWAAGQNTYGQLGDGRSGSGSLDKAVQVRFPAGTFITALPPDVMPWNTALALDSSGNVWGWGANNTGQLCLGTKIAHPAPVQLPLSQVTSLAGAGNHAIYISHRTVYACGSARGGQLGNGRTSGSQLSPGRVKLPGGEEPVSAFSSFENGGILMASGDYYDWGLNTSGQVGDGRTSNSVPSPVQVSLPGPVKQASVGGGRPWDGQTAVQLDNGSWYVWGNGTWWQRGDGRTQAQPYPESLEPPFGTVKVVSGGETLYALTDRGDVYAWGNGALGQLGNGTMGASRTPVLAATGASMMDATANNAVEAP